MTVPRLAPWLAWLMPITSLALLAVIVSRTPSLPLLEGLADRLFLAPILAYALVGAVIAVRRPAHPIGWLFSVIGLSGMIAGLHATDEPSYQVVDAGVWDQVVASLAALGWYLFFGLAVTFALLLFPTGRLPSPRWRPVAWLAGMSVIGVGIADQARIHLGETHEIAGALTLVCGLTFVAAVLASAASLLVRFRRAIGQERQQLKWFATTTAFTTTVAVAMMLAEGLLGLDPASPFGLALNLLFPLALATIPVAAGIAVLRHRLYDIDIIINRALVYGSLTGSLLAVYLGGVVLLQTGFRGLTDQSSDLATIISTLGIAALFQPLRHWLQTTIDHAFYRRKYDAARALAAFSAHLRDEVDLPTLRRELVGIVDETMRPASVSLWVRPSTSLPRSTVPASDQE